MPARSLDPKVLLPPVVSALLLVLAQPPFHVLPLAFLALTPLAVGVASLPPGGGLLASLQGTVFGIVFWGFSLAWVPLEVGRHYSWAFPGYGLLLTLLGGLSALFAWTTHRLYHRGGLPLALALPLAWVGVEWVRAHFPLGLAFPWLGLGLTLTRWPELLGMAEWTGEGGVAFWLASSSGWVAGVAMRMRGGGGTGILLCVVFLAPAFLGWARAATLRLEPGPTVVVVGTHVGREARHDPLLAARVALEQIGASLGSSPPDPPVDIILLPEATIPLPLEGVEAGPLLSELASWAWRSSSPVAVGAMGLVPGESGVDRLTNSAYLILPDGGISQRYDKVRLVPGMEAGRYQPGMEGTVLESDAWVFGPLLCYESLFGSLARRARREGAHALLNLTSDIWFGDAETRVGALFLRQHPAHLTLRAVENRMPVARAANGGYSLVLDPVGRVGPETAPPGGGVFRAELRTTPGRTLFTRVGDLVGPASVLLSILLLLRPRNRRLPSASDPSA